MLHMYIKTLQIELPVATEPQYILLVASTQSTLTRRPYLSGPLVIYS